MILNLISVLYSKSSLIYLKICLKYVIYNKTTSCFQYIRDLCQSLIHDMSESLTVHDFF